VGDDDALDSSYDPDSSDNAAANSELSSPSCERRQFQKRRVTVDKEFNPLPNQEPSTLVMTLRVLVAPTGSKGLQLVIQQLDRR
jgi:hypothetical protein